MKTRIAVATLLAVMVQPLVACWASGRVVARPGIKETSQPHIKYGWLTSWAWTSEKWQGHDEPYTQIRAAVDRSSLDKKDTDVALQEAERFAQQHPSDPQAQFRWGYLAYKVADTSDYNAGEKTLDQVRDALADASAPNTYNYSRLRFLTEAYMLPFPNLKKLGRRLLRQTPDDSDVKYYQATILGHSPDADERRQALTYAHDLTLGTSKHLGAYALLGSIYYTSWRRGHSKQDADNAVAAYQQYLALAPPDHKFRIEASRLIQIIGKG